MRDLLLNSNIFEKLKNNRLIDCVEKCHFFIFNKVPGQLFLQVTF